MTENHVPRIYGVDCPEGGDHVIRLAKALPETLTMDDLHREVAKQEGIAVGDLGHVLRSEYCKVHNEMVQFTMDKIRFIDDSENPPYQPDFVSF
jgi:hypothetical protein